MVDRVSKYFISKWTKENSTAYKWSEQIRKNRDEKGKVLGKVWQLMIIFQDEMKNNREDACLKNNRIDNNKE